MRYTIVQTSEWTYPDRDTYATGSQQLSLIAARGSIVGAQILLFEQEGECAINPKLALAGFDTEWYELVPIPVESNTKRVFGEPGEGEFRAEEHYPERRAPYDVYDCCKPLGAVCTPKDGTIALYVCIRVPEDAAPGVYEAALEIGGEQIPAKLEVTQAVIPGETLINVYWYSKQKIAECHGLEYGSAEFDAMEEKYLRAMRRMRQNMIQIDHPKVTQVGELQWEFDYTETERQARRALALGFTELSLHPLAGRMSWQDSKLYTHGIDVMSYEGYCYISQYMAALRKFLLRNNLANHFRMGVSDEPNGPNEVTYRALAGLMRRLCPEVKLMDALSYCNIHGSIDTYVPLNSEYQVHQKEFETFRAGGDELWQYVCCVPRHGRFINHFTDYALLSTRYQYYGNYKYNLGGYLHWAFFQPQPGQDLFKQSCPLHVNAGPAAELPPGDSHICYNGTEGPWMSMRAEVLRQSAEEYELLKALAARDAAKADAICGKVFRAFDDVEYDAVKFEEVRAELLRA